jgi:hypothetical protein
MQATLFASTFSDFLAGYLIAVIVGGGYLMHKFWRWVAKSNVTGAVGKAGAHAFIRYLSS